MEFLIVEPFPLPILISLGPKYSSQSPVLNNSCNYRIYTIHYMNGVRTMDQISRLHTGLLAALSFIKKKNQLQGTELSERHKMRQLEGSDEPSQFVHKFPVLCSLARAENEAETRYGIFLYVFPDCALKYFQPLLTLFSDTWPRV